jgi:hypothetical protein
MTAAQAKQQPNARLFETIDHAEQIALEAVRKFFDTLDDAFPHLSEDKPRRQIIDSAFEMTEHLVAGATRFAKEIVAITHAESSESAPKPGVAKAIAPAKTAKAPAKTAKAAKSAPTAKKATKASAPAKNAAKKPTR